MEEITAIRTPVLDSSSDGSAASSTPVQPMKLTSMSFLVIRTAAFALESSAHAEPERPTNEVSFDLPKEENDNHK